jgi:CHASE3 domain sensor protein
MRDDIHPTLCRITESYFQMFVDNPAMRDIWTATQADRALQALDEEDGAYLAGLLAAALRPVASDRAEAQLSTFAQLMMTLIAAAVRHALTLKPTEARRYLRLFMHMLPKDVPALP